ncbi:MAG: hypothetical protein LAO03_08900 [Acidobacteriia bacterium]|nr:hypothetical protein [Terriglobia bacterium]
MRRIWLLAILLGVNLAAGAQQADQLKPAYDFSLPREERIKLATSGAPPEISDKATVYVLERTGYVKVHDGSNGFTCIVDRETPLTMEPECFDAEGTATTLLTRFYAEEQRARGVSEQQIAADIEAGYKSGKFQPPRKPGIVYMMSEQNHVLNPQTNQIIHFGPHLMFYAPYATDKDIGNPPSERGMPFLVHAGRPDALIIVVPRQ